MNKRKIIIILLILIIIGLVVYFIANNISITKTTDDEYFNYTPQEEISDKQSKETPITLFFIAKESNQLKSEGKLIDSSDLLKNPYKLLVEKLLEGPSDESLKSVFPENTRIIDANITNNCVTLNFSEEILNFSDETQKYNIINSLLNTLSQLTEVNSIKILINNETSEQIDQEYSVISENT